MKKLVTILSVLFLSAFVMDVAAQKCKSAMDWRILDSNNRYYFFALKTTGSTLNWNFGDGVTSNNAYEYHTYKSKGTYNVCLIRDSAKVCRDTVCEKIVANNIFPCNADFKVIQDTSNALKYTFEAIDTTEEEYEWWKPTYSYNKKKLSYTFSKSGWYEVILYVSNSKDRCVDTVYKTINVKNCSTGFNTSINHGTKTASFSSTSSKGMNQFIWLYGDGNSYGWGSGSAYKNPSHTYTKAGTYWVTLLAYDSIAKCGDSAGMSITINGCSSNFTTSVVDTTLYFYTNNPSKYKLRWDFGNGSTSAKDSGKFVYSKPGTYKVCLSVFCSSSDSAISCSTIVASNKCRASFTANQIGKNKMQFTNNSNGYRYYWTMGDGKGWDTAKNTTYTYSKPGKYWVTLVTYNKTYSCLDSTHLIIDVYGCDGDFSITQDPKNNMKYFFRSPYKTSSAVSHEWYLNGSKLSWKNDSLPIDFGTSTGKYTICHNLIDTINNCSDSVCKSIVVGKINCDSSFTFKLLGDSINYLYSGTADSSHWDFGDGYSFTTTGKNSGIYQYKKPGTYTVCLTVYCSGGDSSKKCVSITIKSKGCNADFSITQDSKNAMKYHFLNPNYPQSNRRYEWYINWSKQSSSRDSFSTVFSTKGHYNVCHIYRDTVLKCSDTVCKTVSIGYCDSSFSHFVRNDSLFFSYTGSGAKSLKWDFGNGYTYKGGVTHGEYQYAKAGSYNVCLTVYCSSSDSSKKCVTINIKPKGCSADFTYRKDSTNLDKLHFTNTSSSSSTMKYWWNFGDGNSSSSVNSSNTYKSRGMYSVCLYISDTATKCYDTICKQVSIAYPICDSAFSYTIKSDSLYFSYTYNAKNVKYNFGDGKTSTNKTGYHVYSKPGNYKVCITAYCSSSDSSKYCVSITIKPKCEALFSVALDTTQKFKLYLINKSSNTGSTQYTWDFGDGNYSGKRNPTHKYSKFGKYNVCLLVIDTAINCSSKYCDTLGLDSSGKLLKADAWELIVLEQTVFGVKKIVKSDFKIYPNPANSKVTIDLSNALNTYQKLEVLNSNGQVCIAQPIEAGNDIIDIDLEKVARGLYLIKLGNEHGYSYMKLIKN